jgi:lipopolysaccharide heptosyltransferase I
VDAPAWRGDDAQAPRDIAIVKPSSLGDVVHTLPAVALLKRHWPASRIRWLVNSEWMPLLDGNPTVDEVVEFPRRSFRGLRGALKIAPWARALNERVKADLVLDFQGLLRSAMIAKLCRGESCRVIGLSDAREGARMFYDATADVSGKAHAVDRYLALVASLGINVPDVASLPWPLPAGCSPTDVRLPEDFVLLHPFSRGKGKSLSEEEVMAFCQELAPCPVVVAGVSKMRAPMAEHVVDLLNRSTLPELIWLIRRAACVVSVDSGPMHIAAALPVPLISIHTWSDPAKVGPYRPDAWIWRKGMLFQQRDRDDQAKHQTVATLENLAAFIRAQL